MNDLERKETALWMFAVTQALPHDAPGLQLPDWVVKELEKHFPRKKDD